MLTSAEQAELLNQIDKLITDGEYTSAVETLADALDVDVEL